MSVQRGVEIAMLSGGMLISGAANSLFNKAQDRVCVAHCQSDHPKLFEQPVFQTFNMFIGECLCLVVLQLLSLASAYRSPSSSRGDYSKLSSSEHQADQAAAMDSAVTFSAATQPTHFHANQATEAPHPVIASAPAPLPASMDPEAEAQAVPDEHSEQEISGWLRCLFALPALCDILATTLMGAGLIFTPVSVYQMTRSALVLWVGLFSVIYLGRKLSRAEILSLFVVCAGVFVVGLSSQSGNGDQSSSSDADPAGIIFGVSLILFAQIFTAAQFVIEEKIMTRYSVKPLYAVGLEGFFGLAATLLIMGLTFVSIGRTEAGRGGYFDAPTAFSQVLNSKTLLGTSFAVCVSIACFNFFGLAVTRTVSATARSTIDTCRTVLIWLFSLTLGWETFKPLQVVGFALTVYGTMCFNGVLSFPIKLGDEQDKTQGSPASSSDSSAATAPVKRNTADVNERTALLDNTSS